MSLDSKMTAAIKELDQVAVAVSVTGTTRSKLAELSRLGDAIADGIHGERPEAKKIRTAIYQRAHDLRVVPPTPKAARSIRALMHAIEIARKSDIRDAPETFSISAGRTIEIQNTWGYTSDEAGPVLSAIEKSLKRLAELGLQLGAVDFALDASWADRKLAFYDHPWSTIVLDPNGNGSASSVASAMGERLWYTAMGSAERESWPSVGAFAAVFGGFLMGDKISADDDARLAVSIGKLAKSWPERAR